MKTSYPLDVLDCHMCSARDNCFQPVKGRGRRDAEILVLAEAPDAVSHATHLALDPAGSEGKRLLWLASQVGFDPDDVYVSYSVKCHLPPLEEGRPRFPDREQILACRKWVAEEIGACREAYAARYEGAHYPLAVIALGSRVLLSLLGPGRWAFEDYVCHWLSSPLFPELGDAIFALPSFLTLREDLRTSIIEEQWKAGLHQLWRGLGLMEKLREPVESFEPEDLPACQGPYQEHFPCRCSGLMRRIYLMKQLPNWKTYAGAQKAVRVQGLDDD